MTTGLTNPLLIASESHRLAVTHEDTWEAMKSKLSDRKLSVARLRFADFFLNAEVVQRVVARIEVDAERSDMTADFSRPKIGIREQYRASNMFSDPNFPSRRAERESTRSWELRSLE